MQKTETVVSLGQNGRVLIPSAFRQSLNLSEGGRLLLCVTDDDAMMLKPLKDTIAAAEGLFKDFAPATGSVADELVAERRQEALKESQPS